MNGESHWIALTACYCWFIWQLTAMNRMNSKIAVFRYSRTSWISSQKTNDIKWNLVPMTWKRGLNLSSLKQQFVEQILMIHFNETWVSHCLKSKRKETHLRHICIIMRISPSKVSRRLLVSKVIFKRNHHEWFCLCSFIYCIDYSVHSMSWVFLWSQISMQIKILFSRMFNRYSDGTKQNCD